jgi:hypothetical protein
MSKGINTTELMSVIQIVEPTDAYVKMIRGKYTRCMVDAFRVNEVTVLCNTFPKQLQMITPIMTQTG